MLLHVLEVANNPKVSETHLAVPGNQNVVLDTPSINVRVHSFHSLPTGVMLPCKTPNP